MTKPKLSKDIRKKSANHFTQDEKTLIKSITKLIEFNQESVETREVESYLLREARHIGSGVCADAYEKDGLVIKLSSTYKKCLLPDKNHPIFKAFVPTIVIKLNKSPDIGHTFLAFQKKADTSSKKKAYNAIVSKYKKTEKSTANKYDLHDDNVGVYKNKPVIFDC
jgi:hypothetical protein